jgi:hypothetical protein
MPSSNMRQKQRLTRLCSQACIIGFKMTMEALNLLVKHAPTIHSLPCTLSICPSAFSCWHNLGPAQCSLLGPPATHLILHISKETTSLLLNAVMHLAAGSLLKKHHIKQYKWLQRASDGTIPCSHRLAPNRCQRSTIQQPSAAAVHMHIKEEVREDCMQCNRSETPGIQEAALHCQGAGQLQPHTNITGGSALLKDSPATRQPARDHSAILAAGAVDRFYKRSTVPAQAASM